MKKLLASAIVLCSFVGTAHAGLLDSVATGGWKTKQTTTKYKLSTYGYDVRVYEWAPKDNPDVRCVFVAGNKNSSGVACYKAKKK